MKGISAAEVIDAVEEGFRHYSLEQRVVADGPDKWSALRELYADVKPGDRFNPYPIDWTRVFTPIERHAWNAIRDYGMAFWPQYPIGPFFADFANLEHKLVIECDGKAFHDPKRDRGRDQYMGKHGWTVFRVSGAECCRIRKSPAEIMECWHDLAEEGADTVHEIREFYERTVDGLVASIWQHYIRGVCNDEILSRIIAGVLWQRSIGSRVHGAH